MPHEKNPRPVAPGGDSGRSPEEPSAIFAADDEPASSAPMSKPRGDDGFGLAYRAIHRFQYTLLHVIGPPRLSASMDPRTRMKAEYTRRKALRDQWKTAQETA